MKRKLQQLDASFTQKIRITEKPGISRNLAILFAHSGDSWFWLLGLVGLYFLGDKGYQLLAIWTGASIVVTAAVVFTIKLAIKRQRPDGDWGKIYRKTDPHSFPSGHAVRAVLLAVLAIATGPVWLGLLFFIWAPLVILSRVAMGLHYVSDVLAGALLGLMIGCGYIIIFPPPQVPF